MLLYAARRLLQVVPILVVMTFVVFSVTVLLPGDPTVFALGENATPQQRAALRERLGLNDPVPVQYVRWAGRALQGDLGRSVISREPVINLLRQRAPVTLELTLLSVAVAVLVGVPAGVVAATRRNSWLDALTSATSMVGVALPHFWLGILLVMLFALVLRWLPPSGYVSFAVDPLENLRLMILPTLTVSAGMIAVIARQTRASLLEVLGLDYVRTARAKGLRERPVIYKHALRNALTSVVTVVGLQVGALLGGAVVTETVFSLSGLGRLLVDAIFQRDFPAIQGVVLFIIVAVLLVNLLVDLAYAYLNPKLRS